MSRVLRASRVSRVFRAHPVWVLRSRVRFRLSLISLPVLFRAICMLLPILFRRMAGCGMRLRRRGLMPARCRVRRVFKARRVLRVCRGRLARLRCLPMPVTFPYWVLTVSFSRRSLSVR